MAASIPTAVKIHEASQIYVLAFAIRLHLDAVFYGITGALSTNEFLSAVSAIPSCRDRPLRAALDVRARDYFEHLLDKYGSKAVSLEKGLLVQAIRYDDDPGFGVRRFSSALLAVATDARAIYGSELDQALIKAAKLPGVTEMIQVLVKKGADPNAADEEGNTALHYAAKRTDPDLILGTKMAIPLNTVAAMNSSDLVKLLLNSGAASHAVDLEGRTLLQTKTIRPA
ncbi:hypothetical protein BN1723_006153 [Verticillium longisporum]|uniref:Uncharacterized protein n=1 Tax=Verticillium longisporum TaxID=100787 RepID=A0A0G4NCY2_VERLO|nr:hypothetical protein BN1723_006153 [Verticillium longisporum]